MPESLSKKHGFWDGTRETDQEVMERFAAIVRAKPTISQNEYDRMQVDGKPGRQNVVNRFGSWANAIHLAGIAAQRPEGRSGPIPQLKLPEVPPPEIPQEESSPGRDYLVSENEKLRDALDKQKNLTQAFIENCSAAIERIRPRPHEIPLRIKNSQDLEFHALRSDAQVGQKTDSAWTQGISVYNMDTYKKRVQKWTEKVLLFREQDKTSLGLNKLVIHCLGDQVEGENIYKGQNFYLDLSLTDQLFTSVAVESEAILSLSKHFPEIEIFCVCGNHGRPGGKGENHYRTNFDYLFYRILQLVLSAQPNIKTYVSESPSMIVQQGNYTFLLNHGDSAKSWQGIPFYGIERMFRRLHDLHGMLIDYELVGHHHQPANICDRVLMNGSLPGGSDLSINRMGLSNRACQKIFYFDKKNGHNRESNLYLEEPHKPQKDEKGIFTKWV